MGKSLHVENKIKLEEKEVRLMMNEGDRDEGGGAKLLIDWRSGHRRKRQGGTKAWGFWGFGTVFV